MGNLRRHIKAEMAAYLASDGERDAGEGTGEMRSVELGRVKETFVVSI